MYNKHSFTFLILLATLSLLGSNSIIEIPLQRDVVDIGGENTKQTYGIYLKIGGGEPRLFQLDTGTGGLFAGYSSYANPSEPSPEYPDAPYRPDRQYWGDFQSISGAVNQSTSIDNGVNFSTIIPVTTSVTLSNASGNDYLTIPSMTVGQVTEATANNLPTSTTWNEKFSVDQPGLHETYYGLFGTGLFSNSNSGVPTSSQFFSALGQISNAKGFTIHLDSENPVLRIIMDDSGGNDFADLFPYATTLEPGDGRIFPTTGFNTFSKYPLSINGATVGYPNNLVAVGAATGVPDIGGSDFNLPANSLSSLSNAGLVDSTNILIEDVRLTLDIDGAGSIGDKVYDAFNLEFLSVNDGGKNQVTVDDNKSSDLNWGQVLYQDHEVMYDFKDGVIRFRPYKQLSDEPEVQIISAAMREGTTYLDVIFRISDLNDETVRAYPLVFVGHGRDFDNVIRPMTFIDGTEANIGEDIPTNTELILTWDVAADLDVELINIKFEILCQDSRELLGFSWTTIPAAGEHEELTYGSISANIQDLLFWQIARLDPGLDLIDGAIIANENSGVFEGFELTSSYSISAYAVPYFMRLANKALATSEEINFAEIARTGIRGAPLPWGGYINSHRYGWYAIDQPYDGVAFIYAWGDNEYRQTASIPKNTQDLRKISAGETHVTALRDSGTYSSWGGYSDFRGIDYIYDDAEFDPKITLFDCGGSYIIYQQEGGYVNVINYDGGSYVTTPDEVDNSIALATSGRHMLALKSDGTIIGWGNDSSGETTPPEGLNDAIAISAGYRFSLALREDKTVVAWGYNSSGQCDVPEGLDNVKAIDAGYNFAMALQEDGSVVTWGNNSDGQCDVPAGLTNVIAISAGREHALALKADGSVVAWGNNDYGQTNVPANLTNVRLIAAGDKNSYAVTEKLQ
ncbi:RCC1 domain-containing protein [Cerasicoccus fimbriatus]|uniref:RCC1 domain-containing protein n=1 Tax=Cerasicoccus fimbriatus TaxID=3014554 RepID=UPI0022B2E745|nr:hypothetical protein [Cerasicoccus sp. TK19100]